MLADWTDTAGGIDHLAGALAILVGGLWAYFKFIRGRTFARRAAVDLAPTLVTAGGTRSIKVTVTLRNTGTSKIDLDQGYCVLYLYTAQAADVEAPSNIDWGEHETVTPIFGDHDWIEAQETLAEDLLIPLRADVATVAYKVVAKVLATREGWRRDLKWTATAVIAAIDTEPTHRHQED